MPKPLDRNALMTFAAQALSARALTISELRDKLKRRAAQPSDIEEVLARLKESGYLNDQRFSESYASWRRDDGGFGKTRVLRDLMARKVPPAVAKQAASVKCGERQSGGRLWQPRKAQAANPEKRAVLLPGRLRVVAWN